MAWFSETDLRAFLASRKLDIRQTHNARWIDQKCTPDVVCIVSDCIENYANEHGKCTFTSYDIWHSEYTIQNVEDIFRKPGLEEASSKSEYDKYFQQPMELLSSAGVLLKEKRGRKNTYSVANAELLSYIAMRERNALTFLQLYIEEALKQSGMMDAFDTFFSKQTTEAYDSLKKKFEDETIKHTPINGAVECRRIFTKVINPLAFKKKSLGTERGKISRHPITYDMLMYNRDNFRDLYSGKPKGMTRNEYAEKMGVKPNSTYYVYMSRKAKNFLRSYNNQHRAGLPEVTTGPDCLSPATEMHHIFPESQYPDIAAYLENIIALSPTQHRVYAHPMGNYHVVDPAYQQICLLAKTSMIQDNLSGPEELVIYEFPKLLYVLATGFSEESFEEIEELDFSGVITKINLQYA